jgi:hypothetical protein
MRLLGQSGYLTPRPAATLASVTQPELDMWGQEFAGHRQMPATDIGGIYADTAQVAFAPATDTYWGTASFKPATGDSASATANFQDGGNTGIFSRTGDQPWKLVKVTYGPLGCGGPVPLAIRAAWNWLCGGSMHCDRAKREGDGGFVPARAINYRRVYHAT